MRPLSLSGLVTTAMLLLPLPLVAQIENVQDPWRWTTFTTHSGLPSNVVYDVRETSNGVVWASTARGLAWYDGYIWHAVGADLGLPAEQITLMLAENDTSVLVIMGRRLFTGNRKGFTELTLDQDTAHTPFISGAVLPSGRALLLTSDGKAFVRDGDLLIPAPPIRGADAYVIKEIAAQPSGRVLIFTSQGLYAGNGREWARLLGFGDAKFEVAHFAENAGQDGAAWVIQPRDRLGLWVWNQYGEPRRVRAEGVPSRPHLIMCEDGAIVQVDEVGVLKIYAEGLGDVSIPAPPAFTGFSFARFRTNGDLWVGGSNGLHLCRLSSDRWESIEPMHLQPATTVLSLMRRRDGSLWIGTSEGIQVHSRDNESRMITSAAGYPLRVITGMAEDADGAVWVSSGFSFTGALRFDGRTWRHFGAADGLDERPYQKVVADHSRGLWFLGLENASRGGSGDPQGPAVYRRAGSVFTVWGGDQPQLRNNVYSFCESPDGSYWFATGNGLSQWSRGLWRHWALRDGLRSERVFSITADAEGRIWFGDQAHGLGVLENGKIRYYTTADGLLSDGVWDVQVDPSGCVWVTTRSGAASFAHGIWNSYGAASGLTHTSVWPILVEPQHVFFGTVGGGVAILHRQSDASHPPRTRIEPPVFDGNNVAMRWQVDAWWGEEPQGGLENRYRLDDGSWSGWSNVRQVDLGSVAPGDHEFTLQVKNQDGIVEAEPVTMSFAQYMPFFLRPVGLAVTALALVAGGLILSYIVRRNHHHRIELRLSEQTSLALLNASTDPSYLLDADGTILAMNQAASMLPRVPVPGASLFDMLPPSLAESRRSAMQTVLNTRNPLRLEDRHDGKHYEHTLHPVLDVHGRASRIAFSSRDVSERRQLEETLQSTVHFLRLLLESSRSVGIISTDRQGAVHFWNTGATQILGYPAEEVVGTTPLSGLLARDTDHDRLSDVVTRVIGAGETMQESFAFRRKDGQVCTIRFTFSPEIEPTGVVQGMLLIGEDITEQERSRQETVEAERQLRLLAFTLNCAKDAFVITDLRNSVLYINQAFIDTYGYTETEILGKDVMIIRSPNVQAELSERIRQGTRASGWSGELMNRRKNGEEFPVELWTSTVRNDHGEPVALVGVAREITERRRTEDQIKASLAEKEVLLKEIHHRVKNNLQIITSLLSLQSGKVDLPEMQSVLRESQTRVKSMALVHEELYQSDDFSRVDFADYVQRLTTNLFHTYQTGGVPINLIVDVPELFLTVDSAIPCGLIINELVSNALKHAFPSGNGGTVTIQLRIEGEQYVLTVNDDGIGIPQDVDPSTTESLGLQLVDTLTRQLGGTLTIHRDHGTQFEIHFIERA
jgi:PAS domain S-box-containing protein